MPEKIVDSGEWGPGTTWELVLSNAIPDRSLCAAVACVAIADIDKQEIVLTLNTHSDHPARKNKWEVLAGHVDPLDPNNPDGPKETLEKALAREAREEAGFIISSAELFGYKRVRNVQPSPNNYPPLAYLPYYWATTESGLVAPTDPGQPEERTFSIETVRTFVPEAMKESELTIIEHGLAAAIKELRGA